MISTPSALKISQTPSETLEKLAADAAPQGQPKQTETAASGPARVHAVIVHHRGLEMLQTCLETLTKSEGIELDAVVVSNNCEEPLPAIVDDHSQVHQVETGRPIGFSEANNVGVRWAKANIGPADYYYFLNNDTESRPDTLLRMVEALRDRPKAAAAGPLTLIQAFPDHLNSLGINVTDDGWGWDEGIGQKLEEYGPLPEARSVLTITGSAYLLEAEVYDQVGGWTEAYEWYFEDIDLGIKIWKQGREVIHVPEAEILHRVSATMTVGAERKLYFFWRNRIILALIHWPGDLLRPLLRRAVYWEIARAGWADTRLQRKALLGALRLLPKALLLRWKLRGPNDWRSFLHPAGSVPVINLPGAEQPPASTPEEKPTDGTEVGVAETPAATETEGLTGWINGRDAHKPNPGVPWGTALQMKQRSIRKTEAAGEPEQRRIMVVGWGPLPFERQRMNYAPGTRTYQLAKALADAGHLVCVAYARIPGSYFGEPPNLVAWNEGDDWLIYQMGLPTFDHVGALEGLVDVFDPHALVGAAPVPSRRAAHLAQHRPVWIDLFGDPMTEGQAKDRAQPETEDGDHLTAYWQLMHELMARGDAFSSVSARQRYSVIGQLGVWGRLNRATAGAEMVHVMPCAVPEVRAEDRAQGDASTVELPAAFSDAFVVMWSGGWNTWCDVDTLMNGLEPAMAERSDLCFLATGGAIEKHDSETFEHLQKRVEASPFSDRIVLLGCLSKQEADQLRDRADLLIVTERPLYERELGSSGRILEWLAEGRAGLCTRQSELGELIAENELGLTYPTGDAEGLTQRLLEAADDRERLAALAERARAYAHEHLTVARTTESLVQWAADPQRAPDLAVGSARKKYHALADRIERSNQSEERLHARYASRPYRVYKRLRGLLPF